jgi:hypothetical protein
MVERIGDRPSREGRNQALFREINERVRERNERLVERPSSAVDWLCECANTDCAEQIRMTPADYAGVRTNAVHFFVAPGVQHVFPDAEDVVLQTDRYWVVRKYGEAAEAAAAADGSFA